MPKGMTIGALLVVIVIVAAIWLVTADAKADSIADYLTDDRGCTDIRREAVAPSDLVPPARNLGNAADEITSLRCVPGGSSIAVLGFSTAEAAQAAFEADRKRLSAGCRWDDTLIVPGPGSTAVTIGACASL